MSNPHTELFDFVLEKLESEPVKRRVRMLRVLSNYAGAPELTNKLSEIADALEHADRACQEFAFQLTHPTKKDAKP